ncbi:hypothetical protein BESB_034340 [Besnoitia besnoiti]|uniref:Transmembrane protein n=1 Tax=Besnoitia besnoiti TaxID=94643 RepID=A0A2A9MLQ3_BESBE|nr:hypothetical protein BESB_034340 [Besnoitia besnoiti]PFH36976.1 hypothetical protein BESB_034340 [Besnoitia besnoiti]
MNVFRVCVRRPVAPRCLYAGDQEATEENRESESLASTRTSTSAGKDKKSRGASEAGIPCLQAPADPSPSARPLLSFELYDTACHNAICRASECLGDSGNKLPPRYFGWVIDGAAYLLVGGLLAVVLAAQATVVERRIDMHIKTLALTSAMYGGIAFWGFEAGRFGPRQSPPAGARRYLLGLCCVGLSALPPILCEVFSPSVGYASLAIPILFHAITTPYLKRPPSSAFAALRRSAAKLKTASTVTRSPVAAEAASQPPSASCTRSASCLKSMPAPPSSPCAGPLSRAASVSVFEPPSVDLAEASSEPPNGGGFLPQWWGSTLSHKCLLGFSLFSAVLGIYSVRKIEGTAEASILRDASESQQPSSRAPAFWAFWRAAEQGRDERDDERRHTEDQLILRRARERLNQLGSNEKPGEKYWGNK